MASDASNLLYLCPFCPQAFRVETDCRDHISELDDGGHHGVNGYDNDRTIEVRHPDIEEQPTEGWADSVATAVADQYKGEVQVPYKALAEQLDLPVSFVAHELVYVHDKESVDPSGQEVKGRVSMKWSNLTHKQQDTLLAWAYFPEKTHEELAGMPLSGHDHQGTVSATIRRYGWIFSHPDAGRPIQPTVGESEPGTVSTEDNVGDLLDQITDDPEPEGEPDIWEGANEADRRLLGDDESGAPTSGGEPRGKRAEDPVPDTATDDDVDEALDDDDWLADVPPEHRPDCEQEEDPALGVSDMDLGFEAMCALVETGRYAEARKLFEEVVE